MIKPKVASPGIHSFGWEGEGRGKIRIQFQNKDGELTTLGDYIDTPQALWTSLQLAVKPAQFIATNLKPHFTWVPVVPENEMVLSGCGCIDGLEGDISWYPKPPTKIIL